MKKSIYFFSPLLFIILVLTIIHVVVANMLSTSGVELNTLQMDLIKYKKENTILSEQVLDQTSLQHIASVAAQMGFIESRTYVSVNAPLPLAQR